MRERYFHKQKKSRNHAVRLIALRYNVLRERGKKGGKTLHFIYEFTDFWAGSGATCRKRTPG